VPPGAGVGSAIGFLRAPFSYEATRGLFQRLDAFDAGAVNAALAQMREEAAAFVARGAGERATEVRLTAFMRYSGQGWEIGVPLEWRAFAEADVPAIRAAFEAAYAGLFGRVVERLAVEITNWSLVVATQAPEVARVAVRAGGADAPVVRVRGFFDAALRREVSARRCGGRRSCPGWRWTGPAVIVEDETSTVVTSAFRAVAQEDGAILILRKEAGA
jgi:N-methylhydantoinase A